MQSTPPLNWRVAAGNSANYFTAYVTAPTAGVYNVTVLSNGTTGSGFQAGGGVSQRGSNSRTLTVTQGPVTLSVVVNGQTIQNGQQQTVLLNWNDPALHITTNVTGNVSGTVTWRLRAQYADSRDIGTPTFGGAFDEYYPATGPLESTPVGTPWNKTIHAGGLVSVLWSLNGGPTQISSFTVLGTNPPEQAVRDYVGSEPWFLTRLITQESNWLQFEVGGAHNAQPRWGTPHGYGLMQPDPPPSLATAFDWSQNIIDGKAKLEEKRLVAIEFWNRQLTQWNAYNQTNPPVPMHSDTQEGLITFTGMGTPGAISFQDAIWIKTYNGATKHYISWLNDPGEYYWSVNNLNNGRNYVADVCRWAE